MTTFGREPKIFVFGDSHSHAVKVAVEKRLSKGTPVPLSVFRPAKRKESGLDVGNIRLSDFLERISNLEQGDVILSMIGGNDYAAFSTLQHPRPFDFFDNDRGTVPGPEAEIVPYRAVCAYFSDRVLAHTGRWLKLLRNTTAARVVHVIPPPPVADNEFIAPRYDTTRSDRALAGAIVSPPELRLKSWQVERRILYKFCAKIGIEVMPPPPKAFKNGFLRPKYYGHDLHHANWQYGELVLRAVEARFL